MRRIPRVSDVIEIIAEKALLVGIGGVTLLVLSGVMFFYGRQYGGTLPLAIVLLLVGLSMTGFASHHAWQIKKVQRFDVVCSYCQANNQLVDKPENDFTCVECNRLIPIKDHLPLPVQQVRCGYCNGINFYSEKTEILLCEECNHEIPIAVDDENRPKKKLAAAYAIVDDEMSYELLLVGKGNKTEDLIGALQHMLALNRNQVKQMLDELPCVLLTGINRRKAEMLQAQLSIHDGIAEMRVIADNQPSVR